MDEKISLEAIALYGDAYSEKMLKSFFSSKDKISGSDILSLCNVQQVNLFVIRELFKAWKEETRKQKSAYFDYEHEEVKEALTIFMSVLSNHISIDRAHFAPLLKRAVSQTLMVIFNPYDFYSMIIAGKSNKLEITVFREEIKYLRINKGPLERMLQKLEEKGVSEIPGNEAFAVLDQVLEAVNFTPEDLEDYIAKFSAVLPLDPAAFYVQKPYQPVKASEPEKKTAPGESKGIVEERKITITQEKKPAVSTLNEHLNTAKHPTLIDSLKKIAKIKDHLSINQKFMFTKVLFYGDFESFSRAVDELDQLPDMNTALKYLETHSSAWDRESKEFHEFMEIVEKKFN